MKSLSFIVTTFLISLLSPYIIVLAQPNVRTVKRTNWKNEPIKILNIKVKDKEIKTNEKFVDDNNAWLQDFTLDIENISSQTVIHLKIHLAFPKHATGKPTTWAGSNIWYGHEPVTNQPFIANESAPPLRTGDKATLKLADYNGLRKFLDSLEHPKILKQITISIDQVFFDDGTMWSSGQMFKRDPNDPEKWRRLKSISQKVNYLDFFLAFGKVSYKTSPKATIEAKCEEWTEILPNNHWC